MRAPSAALTGPEKHLPAKTHQRFQPWPISSTTVMGASLHRVSLRAGAVVAGAAGPPRFSPPRRGRTICPGLPPEGRIKRPGFTGAPQGPAPQRPGPFLSPDRKHLSQRMGPAVNTIAECTVPEKILLAASQLEERGQSPFTAEA